MREVLFLERERKPQQSGSEGKGEERPQKQKDPAKHVGTLVKQEDPVVKPCTGYPSPFPSAGLAQAQSAPNTQTT